MNSAVGCSDELSMLEKNVTYTLLERLFQPASLLYAMLQQTRNLSHNLNSTSILTHISRTLLFLLLLIMQLH